MRYFVGYEIMRDLITGTRSKHASIVIRTSEDIIYSCEEWFLESSTAKNALMNRTPIKPYTSEDILRWFCKNYEYVEVPQEIAENFLAMVAELQAISGN